MSSFNNENVYNTLVREWVESTITTWSVFIKKKSLGIKHIGGNSYKVVNKKKWLLNKIKYGF